MWFQQQQSGIWELLYLEAGPHLTQVISCLDSNLTQGKKCCAYSLNLFLYVRTFKIRIYFHMLLAPVLAGSFKLLLYSKEEKDRKPLCNISPKSSVQLSCSVVSNSLQPHGLHHIRPPCPSPTPGVYPNPFPLSRWCHPAISSSIVPFSSCPQSFPALGSFPMSQLFAWGGQSIGVSASGDWYSEA